MYPNILYNAVIAAALLPMLATEGVKSVCAAAFELTIKGKWALLTFIVVWVVMNFYNWHPVPTKIGPLTGNDLWYLIQSFFHFLAAIGVYNFVRRFINAIEGTKHQTATKK